MTEHMRARLRVEARAMRVGLSGPEAEALAEALDSDDLFDAAIRVWCAARETLPGPRRHHLRIQDIRAVEVGWDRVTFFTDPSVVQLFCNVFFGERFHVVVEKRPND